MVQRRWASEEQAFDVLTRDGRWLGAVGIPEGVGQILEVGNDYMLASWEDELEVPYIRMYRIVKAGG